MAKLTLIQDDCRQCGNKFTYTPRPGRPPKICNECKNSGDVWLTDVVPGSTKPLVKAPKVRHGVCEVCREPFSYTGKGKNKRACSTNCYEKLYAKKPPRKSVCRHCNSNFEFVGTGKLRTSCDDCKDIATKEKEEAKKITTRTAKEIVDHLEMMLRSKNSHISQHS